MRYYYLLLTFKIIRNLSEMKRKVQFFEVDNFRKIYTFQKNRNFLKTGTLGEGSFSKVIKVENLDSPFEGDSKYFAIKISKRFKIKEAKINNKFKSSEKKMIGSKRLLNKKNDLKKEDNHFMDDIKKRDFNFIEIREIEIMQSLNHPNLLKLLEFGIEKVSKESWILLDFLPNDIGRFFKSNQNNPNVMNENFFKNIAYQIVKGVSYLHSHLIIHRDLKPENILYNDKKNLICIADFGLSKRITYDDPEGYEDVGTIPYKPPDVLLGNLFYGCSFDVWSIGCILIEIVTGKILFPENDPLKVLKVMFEIFGVFNNKDLPYIENFSLYIKNRDKFMNLSLDKKPIGIINYIKHNSLIQFKSNNFYDLVEKMMTIDPSKRIKLKDSLNHSWFNEISQ